MRRSAAARGSRRRFLQGAGAGGLAITLGSAIVPVRGLLTPASAQAVGDADLAAFAESVELSLVDAYELAAPKLTDSEVAVAAGFFADHHREHALAFKSGAGSRATNRVNPTLSEMLRTELAEAEDQQAAVEVLFDLENAAAATYLFVLDEVVSDDARALAASILPVESQHAVVLGYVLGRDRDDLFPLFETPDEAWEPDEYPVDE